MNDKEIIIDKIRKLLALSKSPNVNEASISLAKAYDMLSKYNIDIEEVTTEKEEMIDIAYMEQKKIRQWKMSLIIEIAHCNFCEAYRNIGFNKAGKIESMLMNLVGSKVNVEATKIMIDYVFSAIEYNTKKMIENKLIHGIKEAESFKVGYATTIVERVKMIKAMSNSNPDCKDLVIVMDSQIQDFMNKKKLENTIVNVTIDDIKSYVKGRKLGYSLSLEKQIQEEIQKQLTD